jgi:hypothetical protein
MASFIRLSNRSIFILTLISVLSFNTAASVPPINIECPCEIERINQTTARVSFSITFQKEVASSGDLILKLRGPTGINALMSGYYPLGEININSILYSASPVEITVDLPLNKIPKINSYISLVLSTADDDALDTVSFIETASSYQNYGGTLKDVSSRLMFTSGLEFGYDSTTFTINIPSLISTDLRSVSEILNVEILMLNENGDFVKPASMQYSVSYDDAGLGSLVVAGDLKFSIDDHFQSKPEFQNLYLYLSRDDSGVLLYLVDILGAEDVPDVSSKWTNINSLLDTDSDGVSDFNERIIGSDPTVSNSFSDSIIEIAFTAGTSANGNSNGGSNLQTTIAHNIKIANEAFRDSQLPIEIKNIGLYTVEDDSDLDGSAVLTAMSNREGIFTELDAQLERMPDLFIHYSTIDALDTGGIAYLQGRQNDGVLDYENLYSQKRNVGAVGVDNPSLTFAHEVGHLMGLTHSRRQAEGPVSGSFPWSLGYGVDDKFVTIMAYSESFDAGRLGIFSSPDLLCGEAQEPCGVGL